MNEVIAFFVPWEFSWPVQLTISGALLLYWNGMRRSRPEELPGHGPVLAFVTGIVLMYLVTQTRFDYWSQYMFFVHRGQHLVLHHLAPFLIALSMPAPVLARGLPAPVRAWFARRRLLGSLWVGVYRTLQQPLIACVLFVGLIAFWLTPEIHFDAMLNSTLYWVMNWSMALDGLLFWWLMLAPISHQPATAPARGHALATFHSVGGLDVLPNTPALASVAKARQDAPPKRFATLAGAIWGPRHGKRGITPRLGYGTRVLLLAAVMVPQIIIGASITFADQVWFDVYAVCGRAWPVAPITDQHLGGLITWIPAAMMSVVGALVVLRFWIYSDQEAAKNTQNPVQAVRADLI